jgi:hypothetical protein
MWVLQKYLIYRKDKPERGFLANEKMLRWEEGVPSVYVDKDSLKPVDFYAERGEVKPEEVGATLTAWVNNQLAKGLASIKQHQLLLILCIVCSLAAAGVAYLTYQQATQINQNTILIRDYLMPNYTNITNATVRQQGQLPNVPAK